VQRETRGGGAERLDALPAREPEALSGRKEKAERPAPRGPPKLYPRLLDDGDLVILQKCISELSAYVPAPENATEARHAQCRRFSRRQLEQLHRPARPLMTMAERVEVVSIGMRQPLESQSGAVTTK
jgi:hypothetical protein